MKVQAVNNIHNIFRFGQQIDVEICTSKLDMFHVKNTERCSIYIRPDDVRLDADYYTTHPIERGDEVNIILAGSIVRAFISESDHEDGTVHLQGGIIVIVKDEPVSVPWGSWEIID